MAIIVSFQTLSIPILCVQILLVVLQMVRSRRTREPSLASGVSTFYTLVHHLAQRFSVILQTYGLRILFAFFHYSINSQLALPIVNYLNHCSSHRNAEGSLSHTPPSPHRPQKGLPLSSFSFFSDLQPVHSDSSLFTLHTLRSLIFSEILNLTPSLYFSKTRF
jgi:hypothetical protein